MSVYNGLLKSESRGGSVRVVLTLCPDMLLIVVSLILETWQAKQQAYNMTSDGAGTTHTIRVLEMSLTQLDAMMTDAPLMYSEYIKLGGKSEEHKYLAHLKAFFRHTLNSHVFGETSVSKPERTDSEFYLHASCEAAEEALLTETTIGYGELSRIFQSVDTVHAYT